MFDTSEITVLRDCGPNCQWEAARIWAAATAHRDSKPEAAPTATSLPTIQRALESPGATLHLAHLSGQACGFAVVTPQQHDLEIVYLGVDPAVWGRGVASQLLRDVIRHAEEQQQVEVELWVYDDNPRAIDLYLRAGWSPTSDARRHTRSGRLERRYVRRVFPPPSPSPGV
jgi:ribosomal protein S18 acetylase RimI-like enzyme